MNEIKATEENATQWPSVPLDNKCIPFYFFFIFSHTVEGEEGKEVPHKE